jgi:hypothetical protein
MRQAQFLAENLKQGEIYAGLILGKDGQPDYHLVLLPANPSKLNWNEAMTWAASVGGDLPSRREQSLLFANCKEKFEPHWYWSNRQNATSLGYAWVQYFLNGTQYNNLKSSEFRARAVRRIYIEKSNGVKV